MSDFEKFNNNDNLMNDTNENLDNEMNKQSKQGRVLFIKNFALSIFLAVLFGIIIANIAGSYIGGLINGLLTCLTTFGSALIIIFILKHVMSFIENKILKKLLVNHKFEHKIKRTISIISAFLLLILIVFLVMNLIIPKVIDIVTELVNNRETYIYQIKSQLTEFISSLLDTKADDTVKSIMDSVSAYLEDTFNNFLPQVLAISSSTIMTIGQICIGGVLAFLYLYNRENVNKFFAQLLKMKCKPSTVEKTYDIMNRSDRVLLDYIVAKILEAIVITIIIGIGLSILNVKYAFELALIVGILNVIPYIGFIIALVPLGLITIIYGSIDLAIQALIVTTIIYIILTTFITPFIVGKKIKINMLLMFISMVIGGGMFGMIGMAIAPPVACVGAEIFKQKVMTTSNSDTTNETHPETISSNNNELTTNDNTPKNLEINNIDNSTEKSQSIKNKTNKTKSKKTTTKNKQTKKTNAKKVKSSVTSTDNDLNTDNN